jgi:hypothetical protein
MSNIGSRNYRPEKCRIFIKSGMKVGIIQAGFNALK